MDDYKLFAQRIGIIGIAYIFINLSTLVLLPIVTKTININEYGIWVQIGVLMILIPGIVDLGLSYTMVRFLAGEKDKEKIREGFYSIAFIVTITSVIVSLIFYLSSNFISTYFFDGYIKTTQLLSLVLFVACLSTFLINYFRTFQQVKRYSFFLLIQSYIALILIFVFAISGHGIFYLVIALLISYLIIVFSMIPLIYHELGFKFPKFTLTKEYLAFGIPNIPQTLSSWTLSSSDRFIIALFLGVAFTGYYGPGYTLGTLIFIILTPFTVHLIPVISECFDNGKIDAVKDYLRYSQKAFLLLAIPSFFGLSILSKSLLIILTTSQIADHSYFITPFVALGALIGGVSSNYRQIIILEKNTKIIGYIWIIAAISNLVLNILLIPYIGILGAAITTLIGYTLIFVLTVVYSRRYFSFNPDLKFIVKCVIAALVMSLFIHFLEPKTAIYLFIVIIIAVVIYFVMLLLMKGFSNKELKFIKNILNK
jgi:O-antigen/teichoic acid export membrane protein